jgi:hypothetical protein
MTREDVERAAADIAAGGRTPSANTILAWMQQRGMPASKHTILKYMRQMALPPPPRD